MATLKRGSGRHFPLIIALAVMMGGCGSLGDSRGSSPRQSSADDRSRPAHHQVQPGDTLYAIAFGYGLDYRELAAWNGIGPPYMIRPGDRVRLQPAYGRWAANRPPPPATAEPPVTKPAARQPVTIDTGATTPEAVEIRPLKDPSALPPPVTVNIPVNRKPTPPAPKPSASSPPVTRPATPAPSGAPAWAWPTAGQVVGEYSTASQLQRGLDIAGRIGQPVVAAAAGEVVYSGSGLVGYGELVIIKHNDVFLSAYGHNRRRFVKEGEHVNAGQKIAELGDTGANRAKLHFEIRQNGQPVDPRKFLPKR